MNLKRLIVEIQREVKKHIKNINNGGCGYFAFFIANELEKYGVPYKIRVADDYEDGGVPIETKKKNINIFLALGIDPIPDVIVFQHCWIELSDLKFDAELTGEGIDRVWETNSDYLGCYTKEELKVALRYAAWNTQYDVQQNKALREIIKSAFERIYLLQKFSV